MANNIELVQKFVPVIDEIYQNAALTGKLDASVQTGGFEGTNAIKVMKIETSGMGDYSKENGYPAGDVSVTWETIQLEEDRGKEITIDRMDNDETLALAFGGAMGDFMRNHVIPEVDAYRFAKYATGAGTTVTGDFATGEDILAEIDKASAAMDEIGVPAEERILYIATKHKPLLMGAVARQFGNDGKISRVLNNYNDMEIVYVPQNRFYTALTMNNGANAWGYAKGTGAKDINFLMVAKSAVMQAKKMELPKIFDPDTYQKKDSWCFQYRLYHGAHVYENKTKGVYAHIATT